MVGRYFGLMPLLQVHTVLPAVKDGGAVAAVRLWTGGEERGITVRCLLPRLCYGERTR